MDYNKSKQRILAQNYRAIEIVFEDGTEMDIQLEKSGEIRVVAADTIVVYPEVSNVVTIKNQSWHRKES